MNFYFKILIIFVILGILGYSKRFSFNNDIIKYKRNIIKLNSSDRIDESYYSRQLLVYGTSAQKDLQSSHVLIIGNGLIVREIAKNIALSGVGQISIVEVIDNDKFYKNYYSKTYEEFELENFTKALNPLVKVQSLAASHLDLESIDRLNLSSIIVAGAKISEKYKLNLISRRLNVKFISCSTVGGFGYIFNDFLNDFPVLDADGEEPKEYLIEKNVEYKKNLLDDSLYLLNISSIPEQPIDIGIDELVELADGSQSFQAKVNQVISQNRMQLEIIALNDDITNLVSMIQKGNVAIRQIKQPKDYKFQRLLSHLFKPKFVPINDCEDGKKSMLKNVILFAAFLSQNSLNSCKLNESNPIEPNVELNGFLEGNIGEGKEIFLKFFEEHFNNLRNSTEEIKKIEMKWASTQEIMKDHRHLLDKFYFSLDKPSCPATISVVGSIAAQECIKSITHLYSPIRQIMMFDGSDSLPLTSNLKRTQSSPYGEQIQQSLNSLNVLVVGSGAIGCELLKNFAYMGVASSCNSAKKGHIFVVDNDSIEKSNLNRQLLFREKDIGRPKVEVALEYLRKLNPRIKATGYNTKFCAENENLFNDSFWDNIDIVVTALDNVEARNYVDSQCVRYGKWMIDSGTLGSKGNTQVIIPFLTESYSSSTDPPEDKVPVCTVKSFPFQPEHSVAWAKNLFSRYFGTSPNLLSKWIEFFNDHKNEPPALIEWLGRLSSEDAVDIHDYLQLLYEMVSHSDVELYPYKVALEYAHQLHERLFKLDIERLISEHPPDSLDEDGLPFWTGSRRFPNPKKFSSRDTRDQAFVHSIAFIISRIFSSIPISKDPSDLNHFEQLPTIDFTSPTSNMVERDRKYILAATVSREYLFQKVVNSTRTLHMALPKRVFAKLAAINGEFFEKDNEALGHVQFIEACSNIRNSIYSLRELPRLQVKKIAGNIIPALPTSTSLVAGLVCLELLKFVQERRKIDLIVKNFQRSASRPMSKKKFLYKWRDLVARFFQWAFIKPPKLRKRDILTSHSLSHAYKLRKKSIFRRFKNSYFNLALPFFAYTMPVEAETIALPTKMNREWKVSPWQFINCPFSLDEFTIQKFNRFTLDQFGLEVESIVFEDTMVYSKYLPSQIGSSAYGKNLRTLLKESLDDCLDESSEEQYENDNELMERNQETTYKSNTWRFDKLKDRRHIYIQVVCVKPSESKNSMKSSLGDDDSQDDDDEEEVILPLIRVPVSTKPK